MKLTSLLMMFFLTACGESPLLNHKMESALGVNIQGQRAEDFIFKKSNYHFSIDWTQGPGMGESKFILRSWSPETGTNQGPFKDFPHDLHVYLWMPSMGHGSAPVKIKKLDSGEYEVINVFFIMAGKWDIHFQLKNKEVVIDEVVLPLSL